MAVLPRRPSRLLALAWLAVALWLAATGGCLCRHVLPQPSSLPPPAVDAPPAPVPAAPRRPFHRRPICFGPFCRPGPALVSTITIITALIWINVIVIHT